MSVQVGIGSLGVIFQVGLYTPLRTMPFLYRLQLHTFFVDYSTYFLESHGEKKVYRKSSIVMPRQKLFLIASVHKDFLRKKTWAQVFFRVTLQYHQKCKKLIAGC